MPAQAVVVLLRLELSFVRLRVLVIVVAFPVLAVAFPTLFCRVRLAIAFHAHGVFAQILVWLLNFSVPARRLLVSLMNEM